MGASLSFDHEKDQLKAFKDAESKWIKDCGAEDLVEEDWIDLSSFSDDLGGVKQLRILKLSGDRKGPLVILIHGGGGVPSEWAPLFPRLAKSLPDHRIWFIERPGHGPSRPFDYLSVRNSLDEHAAMYIDAVRKSAGVEKFHIAGNSMGGLHTYWYAKHFPERIQSFTWVGGPAGYKGAKYPFIFKLLGSSLGSQMAVRRPPVSVCHEMVFNQFAQQRDSIPDSYLDLFHAFMSLRNSSLSWTYLLRGVLENEEKYYFDCNKLEMELSSKFPCHLIVGENEKFFRPEVQEITARQFGRATVVIKDGGHLPWHEDSGRVASVLASIWV